MPMLRHTLLIIYRGFLRNKTSFLINLIGLSAGLAGVLFIYLWVADEIGVDKFHEHDRRLYQVMINFEMPQEVVTWDRTPARMGDAMVEEFPEVQNAAFTNNAFFAAGNITANDKTLSARRMLASEQFFNVFSYGLIQGDPDEVLKDRSSIAISEELALKLFGSTENVIGKTVEWSVQDNEQLDRPYRVLGVFRNTPAYSTEQFDAVIHYGLQLELDPPSANWNSTSGKTMLVLSRDTDPVLFNEKMAGFLESRDASWAPATPFIQRYSSLYLHGLYENGIQTGGRIVYIRYFSLIAFVILLIACINFMNLSTAQASQKTQQIGIKKSIGAGRASLIIQFLSESLFTVMLALVVALVLVQNLLPQFNAITGKSIELNMDLRIVFSVVGIGMIAGLLAGSYPAIYLSRFNPVAVLKGQRTHSLSERRVRNGLVISQFALSVIFITGVVVVDRQLQYTQTKNLGFSRENVITFQKPYFDVDPAPFLRALTSLTGVSHASTMQGSILSGYGNQSGYSWTGQESEKEFLFRSPQIGYETIETLGMEMVEGRSFSREYADDHTKIIINQAAQRLMQLENPVGEIIEYGEDDYREIIGVVSDFNYGSLHTELQPLIFRYPNWGWGQTVLVKTRENVDQAMLTQIEKVFRQFYPEYEYNYTFLENEHLKLYESERRVSVISQYFAIFAIIISCLGLYGLVAFTAERRTKEIGIRKILGASVSSIVQTLSVDFTKMIVAGILIALPVSFLITRSWLDGFAYKIELSGWFFAGASLLTLLIAWAVIGAQTFKIARVNPSECLQHE